LRELREQISEQVREIKVVIFFEKARNPLAGMVDWKEIWSDVSFNGK
jgi:hypothetical protein